MANETIEVSLGKEGGTKVFDSLAELSAWLSKEQQFWAWLGQQPMTNEKVNIWNLFSQLFNGVTRQIAETNALKNQGAQRGQEANLSANLNVIRNCFKTYYENSRGILSYTPKGKFIEQLKNEQGQGVAAFACGFLMGQAFGYQGYDGFRGAMAAALFELGSKDFATHEKIALEELRLNWQGTIQQYEAQFKADSEKHKKLESDGQELLKKQQAAAENSLKEQNEKLADLVAKTKDEWKNLKATYDTELAIRAPVLYWKQKTSSHLHLAWCFAVLAIVVGGGVFAAIYKEVTQLIEPPKGIEKPELWHPEYWRLAILVASVLVGVWIVRIIVRLFLSNVHLQTDAKERVTMVQTYLALRRRGKISNEDESLILKTLFRPSATGIMKDDGVPLTLIEAFTKLK